MDSTVCRTLSTTPLTVVIFIIGHSHSPNYLTVKDHHKFFDSSGLLVTTKVSEESQPFFEPQWGSRSVDSILTGKRCRDWLPVGLSLWRVPTYLLSVLSKRNVTSRNTPYICKHRRHHTYRPPHTSIQVKRHEFYHQSQCFHFYLSLQTVSFSKSIKWSGPHHRG